MPLIFCLLPILIILFFFVYFLGVFWTEGLELDKILLLGSFLLIILYPLTSKFKLNILNQNYETLKVPRISFINNLFWISFIISVLTLLIIGIPLISGDINVAKTSVSKYPLFMRFFRLGLPYALIILSLLTSLNLYKKQDLWIKYLLSLIIAPLYGFKGYILFIALPLIFFLTTQKYSLKKIILFGGFTLIALMLIVSFVEGIAITDSIAYIIVRATEVNLLGNTLALEHADEFKEITPILSEIYAIIERIKGNREINVLQSVLFERYMGSNPYNMQVSISTPIEYYSLSGIKGIIVFVFFYLLTVNFIKYLLSSSRVYIVGLGLLFLNTFYESLVNGLFFFKSIDFVLSISFILLAIGFEYYIFEFHTKSKLNHENFNNNN